MTRSVAGYRGKPFYRHVHLLSASKILRDQRSKVETDRLIDEHGLYGVIDVLTMSVTTRSSRMSELVEVIAIPMRKAMTNDDRQRVTINTSDENAQLLD